MTLRARLTASALAVALCSHIGMANEFTISKIAVTPSDVDGSSQVKFSGVVSPVSPVCADTSADAGCASTIVVDPSTPAPFACLDTSGDGQCVDAPAAAQRCHEEGRVWVFMGAFEGTKPSLAVAKPSGVCAAKTGAFSGTLSAASVAALTRVGIYASVKPTFGPTTIDADNPATQIGQNSTVLTLNPAATLASLSCAPLSLLPGQSTTATVSMSRPVKTSTMIALSDSSASITTPPSVTIPAGASSATFKVARNVGTMPSTASVKAATTTASKTCDLQLR
jgi:hypothetical protein